MSVAQRNTPDWARGLTRALLAVAVLLGGVWLYARLKSPFAYYGTTYDARPPAPDIRATDQNGKPFSLASLRGREVALFFGFTHCPDICPLTMNYLQKTRAALPPAQRDNVRVVFVSLDPARDTPAKLKDYVGFFGPGVTGLNIPEPALSGVAKSYGVGYQKASVRSANDYQINHTAATYLIDPQGRLRVLYDYTQLSQVDRVARDMQEVLR